MNDDDGVQGIEPRGSANLTNHLTWWSDGALINRTVPLLSFQIELKLISGYEEKKWLSWSEKPISMYRINCSQNYDDGGGGEFRESEKNLLRISDSHSHIMEAHANSGINAAAYIATVLFIYVLSISYIAFRHYCTRSHRMSHMMPFRYPTSSKVNVDQLTIRIGKFASFAIRSHALSIQVSIWRSIARMHVIAFVERFDDTCGNL